VAAVEAKPQDLPGPQKIKIVTTGIYQNPFVSGLSIFFIQIRIVLLATSLL